MQSGTLCHAPWTQWNVTHQSSFAASEDKSTCYWLSFRVNMWELKNGLEAILSMAMVCLMDFYMNIIISPLYWICWGLYYFAGLYYVIRPHLVGLYYITCHITIQEYRTDCVINRNYRTTDTAGIYSTNLLPGWGGIIIILFCDLKKKIGTWKKNSNFYLIFSIFCQLPQPKVT